MLLLIYLIAVCHTDRMWAVFDWHLQLAADSLPACIAFGSISLLRHHLNFLYVVFLRIFLHPHKLLLYGVDVMIMSKWLQWRKRSFFRKHRKKFSFPQLGKTPFFYFLIHKLFLYSASLWFSCSLLCFTCNSDLVVYFVYMIEGFHIVCLGEWHLACWTLVYVFIVSVGTINGFV